MKSLRVTTYNLFLPILPPIRYYGQFERVQKVGEAVAQLDTDVIVFNELVPGQLLDDVSRQMNQLGFHYRNEATLNSLFAMNGGIWLFSKYPIIKEDSEVFKDCLTTDCFISKGGIYCAIKVAKGHVVHVVATHIQAWDSKEYDKIRYKQLEQLGQFIKRQRVPHKDILLLAGDLNLNIHKLRKNTSKLMSGFKWTLPVLEEKSHPYSWDSKANKLVGLDSMSAYTSAEYPHGCVTEYFEKGFCVCCPQETFDLVMFDAEHKKPKKASLHIVPVKVKEFQMYYTYNHHASCQDVSDHFPVTITIKW